MSALPSHGFAPIAWVFLSLFSFSFPSVQCICIISYFYASAHQGKNTHKEIWCLDSNPCQFLGTHVLPARKQPEIFGLCMLRVRFFKKIQDWILKSERIRKQILRFFTKQINPRSLVSWCVKGTEESTPSVDSSVPLTHHDSRDLGLICLVKKRKICFRILSDLRIQSWIFLKKRTLNDL